MSTSWEALAVRLLKRWKQDELVLVEPPGAQLREDLADFLAGKAGAPLEGNVVADWLLVHDEVEDLLCDDDTLARSIEEEARRFAEGLAADDGDQEEELTDEELELIEEAVRSQRIDGEIPILLERFARRTYVPEGAKEDGPQSASKFGGTPVLGDDESWPPCDNCDKPMHLMVQLDMATLPEGMHPVDRGWIQLFYCVSRDPNCEQDCEAWSPGAGSTLVRWLESAPDAPKQAVADDERAAPPFPDYSPSRVTAWAEGKRELPAYGDNPDLTQTLNEQDIDYQDLTDRELTASTGDKLGGWPAWVKDPAYAKCPKCHEPMSFVVQLESKGLSGQAFGELGAGHVLQCTTHPEYVSFGWASH
jgi:Domain of unknown function (DUF1963)